MKQYWALAMKVAQSLVTGAVLTIPIYVTFSDRVLCIARVEGTSMQPTLNPAGLSSSDVVVLDRWSVREYSSVRRGDIVALVSPQDPNVRFVKRVIGLEGDFIRTPRYRNDFAFIPRGHCWIEGDNNHSSLDSNSFGPVSLGLVNGLATHIVWPPHRWGKLNSEIPKSRQPVLLERPRYLSPDRASASVSSADVDESTAGELPLAPSKLHPNEILEQSSCESSRTGRSPSGLSLT